MNNTLVDKSGSALELKGIQAGQEFVCRKAHSSHPLGIFYGDNPLNFSFSLIMLDLVIIILITQTLRFLLKPLRQPRVVSEIIVSFFLYFFCQVVYMYNI